MKELMRIEGLKMYFGGLKAIDGLDLTINEGETLGIIGPNGAGKTTLFNAICGVYKPTDGKVILKGQEVQGLPAHKMARMGIARTFQISKPLADLTSSSACREPARPRFRPTRSVSSSATTSTAGTTTAYSTSRAAATPR